MAKPKRAQPSYDGVLQGIVQLLQAARSTAARAVNFVMTATYWEVGRRIVEFEQRGKASAGYGEEEVMRRLATDLPARARRGFSLSNLKSMRQFYLAWPLQKGKSQTASGLCRDVIDSRTRIGLECPVFVDLLCPFIETRRH